MNEHEHLCSCCVKGPISKLQVWESLNIIGCPVLHLCMLTQVVVMWMRMHTISSMHFVQLVFVFKAGYMGAPLCLAACFLCNIWKNLPLRIGFSEGLVSVKTNARNGKQLQRYTQKRFYSIRWDSWRVVEGFQGWIYGGSKRRFICVGCEYLLRSISQIFLSMERLFQPQYSWYSEYFCPNNLEAAFSIFLVAAHPAR